MSNAYEIIQTNQRRVAKFSMTVTDYLLKVKDLSVRGLREVLHFLEAVFLSILATITTGMLPTDQVRFVMHSPQLAYPISLPFMTLTDLTPRIMFEIERVLQSNEQFSLDGNVHVHLIHVGMPSGGKGKIGRGGVNLQKRRKIRNVLFKFLTRMNFAWLEPSSQRFPGRKMIDGHRLEKEPLFNGLKPSNFTAVQVYL